MYLIIVSNSHSANSHSKSNHTLSPIEYEKKYAFKAKYCLGYGGRFKSTKPRKIFILYLGFINGH